MSVVIDLFVEIDRAIVAGSAMIPRSAADKEFFAQDWFADRANSLPGIIVAPQGRNSYPDFVITAGDTSEGYEVKSLAITDGRPARRDIDFNSTLPSGTRAGRDVFLVFFLYEGTGADPRTIHTVSVAHADLINADHELADLHVNTAIHEFGSYADGFIRDRKMYVFPHPVSVVPAALGRRTLILPSRMAITNTRVIEVQRVVRRVAADRVIGYEIDLKGNLPAPRSEQTPGGSRDIEFIVYEVSGDPELGARSTQPR